MSRPLFKLAGSVLAIAALCSTAARANVFNVSFEDSLGRHANFVYDDTDNSAAIDPTPGYGGTTFNGISLTIEGNTFANPVYEFFDNYYGGDYLYIFSGTNNGIFLGGSDTAFQFPVSPTDLATVLVNNNWGWSEFRLNSATTSYVQSINVTSAVPETSTAALMVLGGTLLAGLGRRRKARLA